MEIEGILKRVDQLYTENKSSEAEALLLDSASVALEENDEISLLQLLNELLGHYRETSEFEKAYGIAQNALLVAGNVCPEESLPYATTLLNIATVYRTGGKLEEAMEYYRRVEKIYGAILKPDSMLNASLYNNESLLFQELGNFGSAKEKLQKALAIVVQQGEQYEEAVSRANLAGTCIQLGELEEAFQEGTKSVQLFEEQGVRDQHLCAAYSALGSYHYLKGEYEKAAAVFYEAMEIMEQALGRNEYYRRLEENYQASMTAMGATAAEGTAAEDTAAGGRKGVGPAPAGGLALCRAYYETYGAPMIHEKFPDYEERIAVGLVGEGSDAFGWDDELSKDHDWGPSFCMWLSEEDEAQIGEALQKAYEELPTEFQGQKRADTAQGGGRRGVMTVGAFYERLLQAKRYEEIDWRQVEDASLAAAVNGQVFRDDAGVLTAFREKLQQGYPEPILFAKMAEECGHFAQAAQYNYNRVLQRGDQLTAGILLGDGLRCAMRLFYLASGLYPPHDKWLYRGLQDLEGGPEFAVLLEKMRKDPQKAEEVGAFLAMDLYRKDYLSDIDPYLDHQTEELLEKSLFARRTTQELAMDIAKAEFEAFDKVQNEGGRAECQDNWPTFNIMRRSQYLTWNRVMLYQYLYDFRREMRLGHNLITEKYGRMMESTAPEKYEEIKENFPELTEEKKAIIERIVAMQVQWMEAFSAEYPGLGQQARNIHTSEDDPYDTSYETYLRGELGTYSDKMLELYARFIVDHARQGRNLARETMENSARLYGYDSLEKAERFFAR